MSRLGDGTLAVFNRMLELGQGTELQFNGLCAQCVASGFKTTRKAKSAGREIDYGNPSLILLESERKRLCIEDHVKVKVYDLQLKVIEIDSHPASPLTKLHLQYQP